LEQVMEVDAMK